MLTEKKWFMGITVTFLYFLLHFSIMGSYGLSWDFHNHFYAGLYHLGLPVPSINDPSPLPFSPPDPRLTLEDPFGPFTQIIPSFSYVILYEKLRLLPFDSAYNFPMIVFGALGILVIFLFISEAIGLRVALWSVLFLSLLPNYFGYLHNNMKDIPNAFAFALSIYLFWRLVKYRRVSDLVWSVASFAFAFNVKINSIMIPVVCLAWLILFRGGFIALLQEKYRLIIFYFIFAPIAALLVWWPFWRDPLGKLFELPFFYSHNTFNIPVLFLGKIYRSGVNIPWPYPYIYILITTPLVILIPFILGFFICIKNILNRNREVLLFLLWLFIPLLRFFLPKTGAIDGVRHFMEIVYPLSIIAAIGLNYILEGIIKLTKSAYVKLFLTLIVILSLLVNIYVYYPYETSFFNSLTGGIRGAWHKFDIDFWGTPQKEAMLWLNKNASLDSYVHVVMAQSTAGVYLRPDLLKNLNKKSYSESDYSVILNRESFFTIYNVRDYLDKSSQQNHLVYQKKIKEVPLVWILKN